MVEAAGTATLVRLPTQFDAPGRGAAPATPTCCCCCCCCVVTAVSSMVGTTVHVRSVANRNGTNSADVTARAVLALPASVLLGAVFPPAIPVIHGVWLYKLYRAIGVDKDRATSAAVVIVLGTIVAAIAEMVIVIDLFFDV